MVNSFGLLLDITVIINILPEVIKILLEKMLKAINLHWLQQRCIREK